MPRRRWTISQDGKERTDLLIKYRVDRETLAWLEQRAKHHGETLSAYLSSCLNEGIEDDEVRSMDDAASDVEDESDDD